MSKEKIIQDAIDEYRRRIKQISFDATTGHLDRMEHIEIEYMVKNLLEKVYNQSINNKEKLKDYEI